MEEEKNNELKILREAKKIIKRKIPGFKEKLSIEEILNNPYICIMIQTALSSGDLSPEERFIIRKITRATYSFVEGKTIDKILSEVFEKEKETPTTINEIINKLKEKFGKNSEITDYDRKIHLLTFAYITAMEDGKFDEKEKFVNELAKKLKISEQEIKRVKTTVKNDFGVKGKKRTQGENIFRNIIKPKTELGAEYKGSKLKALIQMFNFIKDYKGLYSLSLTTLAIMSILHIANPLIIRHIVDNVFTELNLNIFFILLISFCMFGFGLRVISVVSRFISGRTKIKAVQLASKNLKDKVYNHLMHLPFNYYDKNKTGELISICTSDIKKVTQTFNNVNHQFVRILVTFSAAFISMMLLNPTLALLSICTFPITGLISVFFFRKESSTYKDYQEQEARLSTILQENLTGVRVVKAFARQKFEKEKFDKENNAKYKIGKTLMKIHALFWPITDIIGVIQLCISILVGSLMTISGEISLGTLIAVVQFLNMIIWPMKILGRLIVELGKASVSWKRINHYILDKEKEDIHKGLSPARKMKGAIEFKNINFSYEEGLQVLKNINLKIEAGDKVAIIGPTGSGKSTIINLLGRFYESNSGQILIDGIDIKDYAKAYLNDQIGLIHQEAFLFSKNLRENIAFARTESSDEEIYASAKAADIHDNIMDFPEKYNTLVGEKGVTLSGGQKQRTTMARTIIKDPAILILDDSLSAVDTETESRILSAMDKIMENRTSIIIAHRITSIRKANKIIVLDEGEIVQQGTHDELIKIDGIYKSIFTIQSKIEEEIEREVANV